MEYIMFPSGLVGFTNDKTEIVQTTTDREMYLLYGQLESSVDQCSCLHCGTHMHIQGSYEVTLRHLCFGHRMSCLRFTKLRYLCPLCRKTRMQEVPFQAQGHRISVELLTYTRDLLAYGLTNKEVAYLTGLGKNTVKDIDLQRLKERYTIDGTRLIKPEKQARILGIDEFKLHNGHQYAVVIIEIESGHILWLAHGKKKASVHAFIDHVVEDWMDGVEAVACDMNSDFQEVFEERCAHIQPVFDHFHLVRNFNDKVVGQIHKDEQKRLIAEGDVEGAKSLKGCKYILASSKRTLARKDEDAGKVRGEGSSLFSKEPYILKGGHLDKYEELISQNKLLFSLDLIKEKLSEAYKMTDEPSMAKAISEIMDLCWVSKNDHLRWFRRLLDNHFEGIIAHATYAISSGKIEGVNNRTKTLRRKGYGYADDEYFFLKLFGASRKTYVRNPAAHRIPQNL